MGIAENIKAIQDKIDAIAIKCGRNPSEITLIAVSKTKPCSMIEEALSADIKDFGENRPQELAEKYGQLDKAIKWHQIGTLQKNKVKHIVDKAYLIHSCDSLELALEINKRAEKINKIQNILIQVNISQEETKSGVAECEAIKLCKEISKLKNVKIKGLMTISVREYNYSQNKNLFESLARLSKKIEAENIGGVEMAELSMGMTNDFEEAIEAGSTMIRIGTAIFGEREYII